MGAFYSRNISLTVYEADKIASTGGLLGTVGGYELSCATLTGGAESEYEISVFGTKGTGNAGTLILRGKTTRARAILRDGKRNALLIEGFDPLVVDAAVSRTWGQERTVLELAQKFLNLLREGVAEATWSFTSRASFEEKFNGGIELAETGISVPRAQVAWLIATEAWPSTEQAQVRQSYGC